MHGAKDAFTAYGQHCTAMPPSLRRDRESQFEFAPSMAVAT